jgi:hypothetical protein
VFCFSTQHIPLLLPVTLNWSIEGNLTPCISEQFEASVRVYFASDDQIAKTPTVRVVKVRLTNASLVLGVRVTVVQNVQARHPASVQ